MIASSKLARHYIYDHPKDYNGFDMIVAKRLIIVVWLKTYNHNYCHFIALSRKHENDISHDLI